MVRRNLAIDPLQTHKGSSETPTRDAERGFEKMYAHQYEPVLVCRMPNGDSRRLNNGVSANVLNYGRPSGGERYHDAQKPRALLAELITNSTGKRETVLDPFVGSGTTLLAADLEGRYGVGYEIKPELEDTIRRKMSAEDLFAQGAELRVERRADTSDGASEGQRG